MTEKIKDSMETCRIIVHATEEELLNQRRYNDAKEIEVALNDMLKAFRSLSAWEEVLKELEETKEHATDLVRPKIFGIKLKEFTDMCFDESINIIKQKLEAIEEVR